MADLQINDIISLGIKTKGLEILNNQPSVSSLSNANEFFTDEMYHFLMNSRNIIDSPITGSEEFLGQFLKPQSENVHLKDPIHDLLVEYYTNTYVNSIFRKPFTQEVSNLAIVINKTNQYGRCQIGTEIFGLATLAHHIKSSFVLAKFINHDGISVDIYPGQIQYFFEHSIYLSSQNLMHKLALLDGTNQLICLQFDIDLV